MESPVTAASIHCVLKVNTIAVIPHKSRCFCMILDLSHGFKLVEVNYYTHLSMTAQPGLLHLWNPCPNLEGCILPRIIHNLATSGKLNTISVRQVGHKRRFLANARPERQQIQFCLHTCPNARQRNLGPPNCCYPFAPNGMGAFSSHLRNLPRCW